MDTEIFCDVYYFDIGNFSKEDYKKTLDLLSSEKKKRIEKMSLESDRKLSAAGEMLAKKGIAKRLCCDEGEIVFDKTETGKPICVSHDIYFSISHSGSYAACAVSNKPVGIDIQIKKDINPSIAKKVFTQSENFFVFSTEKPGDKLDGKELEKFHMIWTLKEAYLKYTGKGLAGGLKSIDFSDFENGYKKYGCVFEVKNDVEGYATAICREV